MWGSTQAGEKLKSHFTKITTGTWQMYEKNHSVTWTLVSLTAVLAMIQIKQPAYPITHHYWQFTTSQESHKLWHQSSFHNNFYPIIGTVCEVGNCPARVCQHLRVIMVQEPDKSWKDLLDGFYGRCRILIATQVWEGPRNIAQISRLPRLK